MAATTISQLNNELEVALRKYTLERKHYRTGALYKSIGFECVDNGDLNIVVKYSAKFYIQYLEHRQFVDDFFNLTTTSDILSNYVATAIEKEWIK